MAVAAVDEVEQLRSRLAEVQRRTEAVRVRREHVQVRGWQGRVHGLALGAQRGNPGSIAQAAATALASIDLDELETR
jgi:hypothetical protein